MAIEIPLRLKYRRGGRGKYKSPSGGNNRAARQHRELAPAERALHAAQPVRVMVLQANGKIRMMTVTRPDGQPAR